MGTIAAIARTTALLTGAVATAACAHNARSSSATPAAPQTSTEAIAVAVVPLRIESHQSSDVVIYAARGQMRQRLGTVTGATTHTLSIPGRFAADPGGFYLVAHIVGGRSGADVSSPTVIVQRGQTVVWTLESDLSRSELAVE